MNDAPATELAELVEEIGRCTICVDNPIVSPLPHAPRPVVRLSSTARLCIAGQAPGLRVHHSGVPFTDPSGDRLRDWMGVTEQEFYDVSRLAIVPMGFCFPGYDAKKSDLPPRKECVQAWHDRIFALMPQLELILVIGQYAQAYHMGSSRRKMLTETVANWRETFERDQHPKILPLPHPSWRNTGWLKKNPWFEGQVLPVLRAEVQRLVRE
ncbi:MAG: uracil-DNA glycosylase family protein [Rhizobiaceae bacterium]